MEKTIILNSTVDNSFKAILNLKENLSTIKFFNLKTPKTLALGIRQKGRVSKIPLKIEENEGKFETSDINLKENLMCAVVDVSNPFCPEIVLSGSANDNLDNSYIEEAFMPKKIEDTSSLYAPSTNEEVEDLIDKNLEEDSTTDYFDNCAKCKYKEAFYENCDKDLKTLSSEEEKSKEKEINQEESFYDKIKSQIEVMLETNEEEVEVSKKIENSKFVRVKIDEESYYLLGVIYEEEEILYICYGLKSVSPSIPPEDMEEYAKWLPMTENENGEGYWLVFQDAKTGKTIKVD